MNKTNRLLTLSVIIVLILSACTRMEIPHGASLNPPLLIEAQLTVQADTSVPFNAVGQVIKYNYIIKNTGSVPLPGPVTVTGATVTCPGVNTIGNVDNYLDVNETLICTSTYPITQADLDKGSVTSATTANVDGTLSNQVTTTVPMVQKKALTLNKSADPATYAQAGQTITYSYTIKNDGNITLSPGPFTVSDAGLGTAINCGDANTRLAPNATVPCTATHVITQADMGAASVSTSATVSGGGAGPSGLASATTTNSTVVQQNPNPSNLIAGSTIRYTTVAGEGLSQIAHCFGVDPAQMLQANHLSYTDQIPPNTLLNVPNIGSAGPIYGPTCTTTDQYNPSTTNQYNRGTTIQHQVVAGEWLMQIARCYGADYESVRGANPQLANPGQISPNTVVTVPNIGSIGTIYGPPCVDRYPVQSGDTWNSIALKFNADLAILQRANPGTLSGGSMLNVPTNSAGGVKTAGNCMDLSRSLKFAGVNANITHFNLCGVMDASGNMKVGTIKVYQRPEDVGLGGLLQDIAVTIETSTPLNDANSLIVGDVNYDGNDDFRIVESLPPGPNIPYLYYIYDPATRNFVYKEEYRKITSPEFTGNSEIRSQWRESAAKWGVDTYFVVANFPTLMKRETWEVINSTQVRHQVTELRAGEGNVLTFDETVAFPVSGKIQVGEHSKMAEQSMEGELSKMSSKAGSPLTVKVKFQASSFAAGITEMRVSSMMSSTGLCLTQVQMNDAPWEKFVSEKPYTYSPPINWSTFELHVQYRDAQGNLSPVYCGKVRIEGMP